MALGTYTDLKASLAGWLHRSDVNGPAVGVGVDHVVDDWIALFEAEANATLRLRVMETDVPLTMTFGSRYVDLPEGYIEPLGLWITKAADAEPEMLRYVGIGRLRRGTTNASPDYWGIDGETIAFDTPADQAYPLIFRMLKAFALSDTAPTNWLLTNYPNLYLYGCLRHSPLYVRDETRMAAWDRAYQQALQTLEDKEARTHTLATLSVDPAMLSRSTHFDINRG